MVRPFDKLTIKEGRGKEGSVVGEKPSESSLDATKDENRNLCPALEGGLWVI